MVNVLQTVHAEKFHDVNRRIRLYCRAHKEGGLLGLEKLVYNDVDKESSIVPVRCLQTCHCIGGFGKASV